MALSCPLAAPASALVVFPPEAIAVEGDAAPGGGSFAAFGAPAQNEIDDVAFSATLTGGPSASGVFLYDEGSDSLSAVALQGDTAPGTSGLQTFLDFGTPDLDPDGDVVAFRATLVPRLAAEGVFRSDMGTLTAIALAGDPAPGTSDTFASFFDPRVSRLGDAVVFSAQLSNSGGGVFVHAGGALSELVVPGDSAPGIPGASFLATGPPDISEEDEVAFLGVADAGGPGFEFGIWRYSAGTGSLIALDGDPAPGGGSAYDFDNGSESALSLLPGGLLVFSDTTRVFSHTDLSGTERQAEVGEAAPDTGGSFADFVGRPGFGANETYVFLADVSGGSASEAIFGKRDGFDEGGLAAVGDAAPDSGGGSFAGFPFAPSIRAFTDVSGNVTFAADVSGGSATSGVFQLPEPGVGVSLLAGGALLGMMGATRRRRR